MKNTKKLVAILAAIVVSCLAFALTACVDNGELHQHAYGKLIAEVPATCTETGMKAHYYCADCDTYFDTDKNETTANDLVIKALGHAYGELVDKVDATCEDGMEAHYYCTVCQTYFDADKNETAANELVIKALGHELVKVDSEEATCTEDGVKTHWHCNVCKKNYADEAANELLETTVIPALGHDVDSDALTITQYPTSDTEGSFTTGSCKRNCGYVGGEHTLPALTDERYVVNNTATCEDDGTTTYTIVVDGITVEFEIETKAFGHAYGELIEKTDATCEEDGMEAHYYCAACQTYFDADQTKTTEDELIIAATGHDYGTPAWRWTFTEIDGYIGAIATFTCSKCNDSKTEKAEQLKKDKKEATCTEAGKTVFTATLIFNEETYTDTREINVAALGHDFEDYTCKRGDFDILKALGATLEADENKVYFVVSGKFTFYQTSELESVLAALKLEFQRNGFRGGSDWSGDWTAYNEFECSVSFEGDVWTIKYDVTAMPANASDFIPYYTGKFHKGDLKLPTDQAADISVTVNGKSYALANFYGQDDVNTGYGTVALKVTDISEPAWETTLVTLETNESNVYFVIKGTYNNYSESDLKSILTDRYFDLQQRGGDWARKTFDRTVSAEGGVWTINLDVTALPLDSNPYTGHFGGENVDLKLDASKAEDGYQVALNGRIYTLVNKAGSTEEADNWGCVSLKVESAIAVTGATLEASEDGRVYLVLSMTAKNFSLEGIEITIGSAPNNAHSLSQKVSVGDDDYKLYFDVTDLEAGTIWCHLYFDGEIYPDSYEGNIYAGDTDTSVELNGKTYKFYRGADSWWVLQLIVEE